MKYFQILLLIFLASCLNQETLSLNELEIDFFDSELNWASNEPVLKIYFESKECGEWGGHKEHLTVSKKNNRKYKLEYKKYKVNCDSIVKEFNGIGYIFRPINTLDSKKEIEIKKNEKQAILNFSFDMIKSKFNEEELTSHAEVTMSICNSDSTFYILRRGGQAEIYSKLLKALKID
jgi:hypothetical protein